MVLLQPTQRAVVVKTPGTSEVVDKPIPKHSGGASDVLVKIKAAASNPTDWKHRKDRNKPGAVLGCDFAGEVAVAGGGFAVGDRVAGFERGGHSDPDNGAFAREFCKFSFGARSS
jgi:NADPH:quinone reductase-like Zn-dependent oxidoreductase